MGWGGLLVGREVLAGIRRVCGYFLVEGRTGGYELGFRLRDGGRGQPLCFGGTLPCEWAEFGP